MITVAIFPRRSHLSWLAAASLITACGGGGSSVPPAGYAWLPEDSATVAAAVNLFVGWNAQVSPNCGSSVPIDCPGGIPGTPIPLSIAVTALSITKSDSTLWPIATTLRLRSATDIPITIPIAGQCGLHIDTTPGVDSTITINVPITFVRWPSDTTLNQLGFGTVTINGLTTDDVALTGGTACQIAGLSVGSVLGLLTSNLASRTDLLCGIVGPVLFQSCPAPAAADQRDRWLPTGPEGN